MKEQSNTTPILPSDLIDILIQCANDIDNSYWRLGDITTEVISMLYPQYTKHDIRAAIGNSIGWDQDTLRDQQRMCEKIPAQKRRYQLSRHQYRACLSAGEDWELYADKAIEYGDEHGGKSAPVNVIRKWIKGDDNEEPKWPHWLEKLIDIAEKIYTSDAPEPLKEAMQSIINLSL